MTVDWAAPDLAFLLRQMQRGNVVLFAGAGFSADARNRAGETPPLGKGLAEILAREAGLEYRAEPLSIVYHSAESKIGTKRLHELLYQHYAIENYPAWYEAVASVIWHRLYTTNIDNLLQNLYRDEPRPQNLRTVVCPAQPQDRDPHFKDLQCIHLHGHIEQPERGFTFTIQDFAALSAGPSPWYQALAEDSMTRPMVYMGTLLEEPTFHHYLEIRLPRVKSNKEVGPKSFLVCRSIGPIRAQSLKARNIVPIGCDASDFFTALIDAGKVENDALQAVRRRVFPHLIFREGKYAIDRKVNLHFDRIVPGALPSEEGVVPESFFLGAEPTWSDIASGRDAARSINVALRRAVETDKKGFRCVLLHGPAGSGKSTTMMRVAHSLAEQGDRVYFARGEDRIDFSGVVSLAQEGKTEDDRIVVVVDVATRHLGGLGAAREEMLSCSWLTLLLVDRSNAVYSRWQSLSRLDPEKVQMPDLDESDAESVIGRLEEFGLLGVLRSKPRPQQVAAFMERANKQLLVAMREATSGKGFDIILRSEYEELEGDAKLAYVMCCLAVAKGAPGVYRRQLVPALGQTAIRKTTLLNERLRGIVVPANQSGSLLKPRHRLIGHWIAREIADDEVKYDATRRLLAQMSNSIVPNEIRRRAPAYLAYRGMINSEGLWETFSGDSVAILALYEELFPFYQHDFLFLLQYGMAHIRAGHLDLAENYLNQSLAVRPEHNFQTEHQLGVLYLLQAVEAAHAGSAVEKAAQGIAQLRAQILARGDEDSYPHSAYLTHVGRWYAKAGELISQKDWESLRRVGLEAKAKYGLDPVIADAVKEVERLYMMRAVKDRSK